MDPKSILRILAAGAAILLSFGCASTSTSSSTPSEPTSNYYAEVRVESAAMGGNVKVNGQPGRPLPALVRIPTDAEGRALTEYVIEIGTNVMGSSAAAPGTFGATPPGGGPPTMGSPADLGRAIIAPGDPVPSRINFNLENTQVSGTAQVQQRT